MLTAHPEHSITKARDCSQSWNWQDGFVCKVKPLFKIMTPYQAAFNPVLYSQLIAALYSVCIP